MALSQNSKILVSDITSALAGKQDALGFAPVKSVNGSTPDTNGNVTISATPTTVKGVIGSAVAANSTSMTLPSGGTWFVANSSALGWDESKDSDGDYYYNRIGVGTGNGNSGSGYAEHGNTFAGGTTVYAKKVRKYTYTGDSTYSNNGKLIAIRIA